MKLAVVAAACLLAAGCQKEEFSTPLNPTEDTVQNSSILTYSIDGISQIAVIHSEEEMQAFYSSLLAIARQGHKVTLGDYPQAGTTYTKELQTFSSSNEKEVIDWAEKMRKDGYVVTITYDPDTNIYYGEAYKKN